MGCSGIGDGWRGVIFRPELVGRRSCGGEGREEEAITGMAAMTEPRDRALIQDGTKAVTVVAMDDRIESQATGVDGREE